MSEINFARDLIYLASPYTDPSDAVKRKRRHAVAQASSVLIQRGYRIYSPIVHTLGLCEWGEHDGTTWNDWADYDSAFVRSMPVFAILMLPGWQASVGVTAEHLLAWETNKRRFLVDPETYKLNEFGGFPGMCHPALDATHLKGHQE